MLRYFQVRNETQGIQTLSHAIRATCDQSNRFEDMSVHYMRRTVNGFDLSDLGPRFRKAVDFIGKFVCVFSGHDRSKR